MKLTQAEHRRHPIKELTDKREWKIGKAELTLYRHDPTGEWIGTIRKGGGPSQSTGDDKDQLIAEMEAETSPPPPPIRGYKGAIERFLYLYPGGFENAAFLRGERGAKVEAGDQLKPHLDSKTTDEEAVVLLRAARALLNRGGQSPLHMTESSDLDAVWRGPSMSTYIHALRAFAAGDRLEGFRMSRRALDGVRCSWPMVTLFPALLRRTAEAVLRPEAIKTYAHAVRSAFAEIYEPEP
ncbi:MAG: hypothetical protein ACR2F8_08860, partial [Caulobacteraceae bacterium]